MLNLKTYIYKLTFPFLGLASAMFIHFAWNLMITFEKTEPLGFIFMLITILIFIVVFSISVSNDKRIIYNELLEEAENGIIPMNHIAILNSSKRNNFGWIDEKIRKIYIQTATTLAFRKMQLSNTNGYNRIYYENDVHSLQKLYSDIISWNKMNKLNSSIYLFPMHPVFNPEYIPAFETFDSEHSVLLYSALTENHKEIFDTI